MSKTIRNGVGHHLGRGGVLIAGIILAVAATGQAAEKDTKPAAKSGDSVAGREIFMREWLPNDPRSHGGDGLGPVFNDSSCVACHNLGGAGGGGAASKNVNIVSATFNRPIPHLVRERQSSLGSQFLRSLLGLPEQRAPKTRTLTDADLKRERDRLVEEVTNIHPGFRTANSVVIHHFGADESYENWKSRLLSSNEAVFMNEMAMTSSSPVFMEAEKVAVAFDEPEAITEARKPIAEKTKARREFTPSELNQGRSRLHQVKSRVRPVVFSNARLNGHFAIAQSQRNATALFGAGLIDAVPDKVLEEAEEKTYKGFPEISGRVARLPDGKIGRYGWKAQKATLRDFTVTACAVELGLHVPEHPQSGDPNKPEYQPAGFDLTKEECDQLVDYLRNLPAPEMRKTEHPQEQQLLQEGKALFATTGCATCHTENLGPAEGIFSDLLVHDLGPELGDTGSYGVFLPDSPGGDDGSPVPPITELTKPINHGHRRGAFSGATKAQEEEKVIGATNLEWRTPPLWGVRDSAPYLHDGRAKTLEEAVAMHGGEGQNSATHFFALKPEERQKVIFFLKSLEAPTSQLAER